MINIPWSFLLLSLVFLMFLVINIGLAIYTAPTIYIINDIESNKLKRFFQQLTCKNSSKLKIILTYSIITCVEFLLLLSVWFILKMTFLHYVIDVFDGFINSALNAIPLTLILAYVLIPLIILYAIYIFIGIREYTKKRRRYYQIKKRKTETKKSDYDLEIVDVPSFLVFKRKKVFTKAKFQNEFWYLVMNDEQLSKIKGLDLKPVTFPCIIRQDKQDFFLLLASQAMKLARKVGEIDD